MTTASERGNTVFNWFKRKSTSEKVIFPTKLGRISLSSQCFASV